MSYKYRSNYHQQPTELVTAIIIVVGLFVAGWFIKLIKYVSSLSNIQKIGLIISLAFMGFMIGFIYLFIKSFHKSKPHIANKTHNINQSYTHPNSVSYNSSIIGKKVYPKTSFFIPRPITINDPYAQIQKLREVHPKYFEDFISEMFKLSGYIIEQKAGYKLIHGKRQAESDGGIDLIVSKDGAKKYVQVKKLLKQEVGVAMIRDFYGAITDNLNIGDEGIFITTSIFSQDAQIFANEKGIRLINYEGILKIIKNLWGKDENNGKILFDILHTGDNTEFTQYARTCKRCYAPLVNRKKLGIYGCMNYTHTGCKYSEC